MFEFLSADQFAETGRDHVSHSTPLAIDATITNQPPGCKLWDHGAHLTVRIPVKSQTESCLISFQVLAVSSTTNRAAKVPVPMGLDTRDCLPFGTTGSSILCRSSAGIEVGLLPSRIMTLFIGILLELFLCYCNKFTVSCYWLESRFIPNLKIIWKVSISLVYLIHFSAPFDPWMSSWWANTIVLNLG